MRVVWGSSLVYSATVLLGSRWFDSLWFAATLTILAFTHLVVVVRRPGSWQLGLLASQLLVTATSLYAIVSYLLLAASPTRNVSRVLRDFAMASWTTPGTYLRFALYLLVFGAVTITIVLLLRVLGVVAVSGRFTITRCLYVASAVNVACDFAWRRPLFHVQGEPVAQDFFFAAGLFGVEFSLPTYVLAAVLMASLGSRDE